MDRLHTDREYEAELSRLREQIIFMSAYVEQMLGGAMDAFRRRDAEAAKAAAALDNQIDQMELDIDNACLSILARRQPVASDLRFITTALKVVTDLERIGDLATNICHRVIELGTIRLPVGGPQIEQMAVIVGSMLREVLDAFVARDAQRADSVRGRDQDVDRLYADMFPLIIQYIGENPESCASGVRVLSIAKHLERVADHATNLSEMVIFMVEGEDVRHLGHKPTAN